MRNRAAASSTCEREAVERAAHLVDRGKVFGRRLETGDAGRRAFDEESDGLTGAERLHGDDLFAADAEYLATGCQRTYALALLEDTADERTHRLDEMLAVVENEQQLSRREVIAQRRTQGFAALTDAQHLCGESLDLISGGCCTERHEPHAVGELIEHRRCCLQRQACLSTPPGSRERHETTFTERLRDFDDVELAADHPVGEGRKVIGPRTQRA